MYITAYNTFRSCWFDIYMPLLYELWPRPVTVLIKVHIMKRTQNAVYRIVLIQIGRVNNFTEAAFQQLISAQRPQQQDTNTNKNQSTDGWEFVA
jgi:hypothetical protein